MSQTHRTGSLFVIFLTVFIDLLGFGMVLPLLPNYADAFGEDEHGWLIGTLMASFSAMQFLFAPLWGRLSDRVGRRPVIVVGLLGSTVFYALFGLAAAMRSLPLLFAARIGAGIAGATISTAQAYIADCTTVETRAKGMALIGASFGLGFTFGPLLGFAALWLSDDIATSPWPGYVAALLSAAALTLAIFKLPESLSAASRPHERGWISRQSLSDAVSVPSIAALLATSFVSLVSFGGFETTISLLLKRQMSFDSREVLLFFAYIGLVLTLAQGFLVRRLSGRIKEGPMAIAGLLISVAGFLLLAQAAQQGSLAAIMAAVAVEVTGFSMVTPSVQSLISRRSDPSKQGGILGLAQGIGALARIVGPLAAIPLFFIQPVLPYWVASGAMCAALGMLAVSLRGGKDFVPSDSPSTATATATDANPATAPQASSPALH